VFGECIDHACVCDPFCVEKVCGSDGCGGSCGECPDDKPHCLQGQCSDTCDIEQLELAVHVQKIVYLSVGKGGHPGEALDVDGALHTCAPADDCEDGLDNVLSGLIYQLDAFLDVDVDAELAGSIEQGDLVCLFEFGGGLSQGLPFAIQMYSGIPALEQGACVGMTDNCPYYVPDSDLVSETCHSIYRLEDALVVDATLVAGGPDSTALVVVPLLGLHDVPHVGRSAVLTADISVTDDAVLALSNGLLAAAIPKKEIVDSILASQDDELPLKPESLANLVSMFLQPDIDLNGDGVPESASVAFKFETIPAVMAGIKQWR